MSKPHSYFPSMKRFENEKSSDIHKTILRNAEIPINSGLNFNAQSCAKQKSAASHRNQAHQNKESLNSHGNHKAQSKFSKQFHEPRTNKLEEMKKALKEIKSYEANNLESIQDMTKNSQELANREVKLCGILFLVQFQY